MTAAVIGGLLWTGAANVVSRKKLQGLGVLALGAGVLQNDNPRAGWQR